MGLIGEGRQDDVWQDFEVQPVRAVKEAERLIGEYRMERDNSLSADALDEAALALQHAARGLRRKAAVQAAFETGMGAVIS